MTIDQILLIAGAICLGLAAASVSVGRINLQALGLLLWILTLLL